MAEGPKNGGATDGKPADDLEKRRRGKQGDPLADENKGASIEERAGEPEEEEDGQYAFGLIEGDKPMKLSQLVKTGLPIEVTVSIMSGEVDGKGLIDPEIEGHLVVTYKPVKYEISPQWKEGRLAGWKVRQSVRPIYSVRSNSEHGLQLMRELVTATEREMEEAAAR